MTLYKPRLRPNRKSTDIKGQQKANAAATTDNTIGAEQDKEFRRQAEEAKQAADATQKAWEKSYKEAVSRLQQTEREKIDATKQGSTERLAVINSAVKEEQSKGLQDTGFYKSLLTERVNITRQMGEEQAKIEKELAAETLKQATAMSTLKAASEDEAIKHSLAMRQTTGRQAMDAEIAVAQERAANEQKDLDQAIASLDKHDADYLVKLQQFEDKKKQLIQKAEKMLLKFGTRPPRNNSRTLARPKKRCTALLPRTSPRVL